MEPSPSVDGIIMILQKHQPLWLVLLYFPSFFPHCCIQ